MWLEVDKISVSRGNNLILDNASLEIERGQFASLLGPSGAGKTTMLSVIAGLLPQESGSVRLDGKPIDDTPAHQRNIAVAFQDIRLFPHMNMLDNVAFPLKMRGMGKQERYQRAHDMLEAVHLPHVGKRRTGELSGGQQQRVALARALAAQPSLLLLDEPFSGLDEQLRDDMRDLLLELHEQFSTTTLMVTHDADEALTMSDCIAYLEEGRILQQGSPAELLFNPSTQAVLECFDNGSVIEGHVSHGEFRARKLVVPAPNIADGPAAFIRAKGATPFVHPLE